MPMKLIFPSVSYKGLNCNESLCCLFLQYLFPNLFQGASERGVKAFVFGYFSMIQEGYYFISRRILVGKSWVAALADH